MRAWGYHSAACCTPAVSPGWGNRSQAATANTVKLDTVKRKTVKLETVKDRMPPPKLIPRRRENGTKDAWCGGYSLRVLRANASRLLVYRVAFDLATEAAHLAKTFQGPGGSQRGDQLVLAALSVASNIAEACGRGTPAEFRRFLDYAAGSAAELRTQLRIARTLDPERASGIRLLENRATLALKMLRRLSQNPPPLAT